VEQIRSVQKAEEIVIQPAKTALKARAKTEAVVASVPEVKQKGRGKK